MLTYIIATIITVISIFCYKYRTRIITIWKLSQSLKIPMANSECILDNDKATIQYNYRGISHDLYLPFDKNHAISMIEFKVELLKRDGIVIDITQQPGIPYLVTAASLGGYDIRITNEDNKKVHNYGDKIQPGYGIEVM